MDENLHIMKTLMVKQNETLSKKFQLSQSQIFETNLNFDFVGQVFECITSNCAILPNIGHSVKIWPC